MLSIFKINTTTKTTTNKKDPTDNQSIRSLKVAAAAQFYK